MAPTARLKEKLTMKKMTQITKNLSLCLTNKALRHEGVWGCGCIDPRIFDFDTSTPVPTGQKPGQAPANKYIRIDWDRSKRLLKIKYTQTDVWTERRMDGWIDR
jgi:hypothetical protein